MRIETESDDKNTDVKPRGRKLLRLGVLGLLVAILLGLPLLNLALATPFGLGFVGRKVSSAIRLPVVVGGASYTPWGGVKLKDLRVEQVAAAGAVVDDPFFSAARFEADVRLFSLLSDEVVIDRLVCESPMISMVRQQRVQPTVGGLVVPAGEVLPEPQDDPKEPQVEPASDPVVVAKPARRRVEPVVQPRRRKLILGEVEVRGGGLKVTMTDGNEVLRLDGLRLVVDLSSSDRRGTVEFDKAKLLGLVDVLNFVSPVQVEGKRMTLDALEAECKGGEMKGDLVFERRVGHEAFLLNLTVEGVEVAEVLEGRLPGLRSGKIDGQVALRGTTQSIRTIEGGGKFSLASAVMAPDPELAKLRKALRVDAEGNVELEPAEVSFAISNGVLGMREASFGSGELLVKAVGGIRFDGTLNVSTRVYLGESLYSAVRLRPVSGRTALVFNRLAGTDWHYRDEIITGRVKQPLIDLWRTGEAVPVSEAIGEFNFDFGAPGGDAIGGR